MSAATFAEQYVDRRQRTEIFDGRPIEVATGRVLLHAAGAEGRALCGQDQLTPTDREWSAEYLPHLPRCRGCATALAGGGDDQRDNGPDRPPAPASGLDIRVAHGTEAENAAAAALRSVLAGHDLRRWMFTDLVTIDETITGGFSHPLTLSPPRLLRRPLMALTTFLHEQLHWIEGPGTGAAAGEARERWPDPPGPPGGCHDAESTWLHMSVCALEYFSLGEVAGQPAASAELAQHVHYAWLYEQILADPAWFAGYLRRHGLEVPGQPPVPRRYCGEAWWEAFELVKRASRES